MAIRLVGELLSPTSCPLANVTITLKALTNSASVLMSSTASTVTDYKGRYDFSVPTGTYSVTLEHDAVSKSEVGQIQVFSDSTESTLQALLDAPTEEPSPVWYQQIEEALAQSKVHADAAAKSAADAAKISEGVEQTIDAVRQHADRASSASRNAVAAADGAKMSQISAQTSATQCAQRELKVAQMHDEVSEVAQVCVDANESVKTMHDDVKIRDERTETNAQEAKQSASKADISYQSTTAAILALSTCLIKTQAIFVQSENK